MTRPLLAALALATVLGPRGEARAHELTLPFGSTTLRVGVTQSLTTSYHADRDPLVGNPGDQYWDFKNRTDLTLQHGSTSFNTRFDFDLFAGTDAGSPHENELDLEKVSLSSVRRSFELAAGDFHVRLGRGLALDLTRVDDVARDTTLRGARVAVLTRHVEARAFGGWVNPLNVDDLTGLRMDTPSDVIGGGRVEVRPLPALSAGLQYVGAWIEPRAGGSRDANHILGVTLELHDLGGWLSAYGEFDYMRRAEGLQVENGTGTYVSVTGTFGSLAAMVEFKWYRSFQLLNDYNAHRQPLAWMQEPLPPFIYHRPPTLMWSRQEVINNHDVIGPRARLDYRIDSWGTVLWASYGRFFRSDAQAGAGFFDQGVTVNDVYGGIQQRLPRGALDLTGGHRLDTRATDQGSVTDYSQSFAEAELSLQVHPGHSVELEALYRKVEKSAQAFSDVHVSVGYRPSRWFAGSVTYEYSDEFPDAVPDDDVTTRSHFGGAAATVNFTPGSHARLFGGSTKGGMRCIDGFCQEVPPFVGVKLDLVLQI